jgi:hypothetical protein
MQNESKRILSTLLAFALVCGVFAVIPVTVNAADATTLASTINSFAHGGTGTLNATVSGNTVTVTGTVTDARYTLFLDIDDGATVVWKADYSSHPTIVDMIYMTGGGTLEVATGGSIKQTSSSSAVRGSFDGTVKVSGGTISATTGEAIFGKNIIVTGGTVSATTGRAISTGNSDGANITISGGTVSATSGKAIDISKLTLNAEINISGGTISTSGDGTNTILSTGEDTTITVSGGTVSSSGDACTILANGAYATITVNGGTVKSTGKFDACAILAPKDGSEINVTGGTVSTTVGETIYIGGTNSNANVNGGMVKSTEGIAISGGGPTGAIYVSGTGVVESGGDYAAIQSSKSVNVLGGTVRNTGTSTWKTSIEHRNPATSIGITGGRVEGCISAMGDITMTSGTITNTTFAAMYIADRNKTFTISGGFVFAYGKSITDVIANDISKINISGNAVACAWDKPSGTPKYDEGTSADLTVNSGATANWGIRPAMDSDPAQNGIIYFNGANTGFFPISGVTFNVDDTPTPPPPGPLEWVNPFIDVKTGDWFYNDVKFVHQNGLFAGTSANTFRPGDKMTRAMIITVIARYAGIDTSGEPWYAKAVAWGVAEGITDGSDLNGNVTREQLAALLWRYEGQPIGKGDLSTFTDSDKISDWAIDAMKWAVGAGLISGYPDKTVGPQGNATRAEVAAIMHRFVEATK